MTVWSKGDRVMVYSNKGKLGKATVIRLINNIAGNPVRGYMKVRMDYGLKVYVKRSFCRRLISKEAAARRDDTGNGASIKNSTS